jgi:octaprenyl-diphosphate synthase
VTAAPSSSPSSGRARWYDAFLEPVAPTIRAALGGIPADVPRAGLGGAIVVHVARGYGTRRWRDAARVAVLAVETYNQRVCSARTPGLEHDVSRLRRVWRGILDRDEALFARVIDHLRGDASDLGDHAMPECVVFLRLAVAAGVLAGDASDEVHRALDRFAVWLGLHWEATQGTLDTDGMRGALRLLGEASAGDFVEEARAALAALPDGQPVEALGTLLARSCFEGPLLSARDPAVYRPESAPQPRPRVVKEKKGEGPLATFAEEVREPIERALAAVVDTDAHAMRRACLYLQWQGGKRVRPLLTTASAFASGGDPAHALHAAALVEWLHQTSLVIDDVVDEATLRRNGPTLHHATSVPFAAAVSAFLLGRLHAGMRELPRPVKESVLDTATALLDGQRMELVHTGDPRLSETAYFRIIEAKTARLFACAAALGGAQTPHKKTLARFGKEVGIGFQIADDLLDCVGEEAELGKRPGTDLRAGKITLPVILLKAALAPEHARTLEIVLQRRDEAALPWIRARMEEHDVVRACLARAEQHLVLARKQIARLPHEGGRLVLTELAEALVHRRR